MERTDQRPLDALHEQRMWQPIAMLLPPEIKTAARKYLTSRVARYSGLLSVLTYEEGDPTNLAQIKQNLQDVTVWLALNPPISQLNDYLLAAKGAGVQRVVLALGNIEGGASDWRSIESAMASALKEANSTEFKASILVAGKLSDGEDEGLGAPIRLTKCTDEDTLRTTAALGVGMGEFIRVAAEALLIPAAHGTATCLSVGNEIADSYLRSLRQKGLSRRDELGELFAGGFEVYEKDYLAQKEKEAERQKRLEQEEEQTASKEQREKEIKELFEKAAKQKEELAKKKEEDKCREILAREWRERYYAGQETITEEEYIKVNWERGIDEARKALGKGKTPVAQP